ncbi:hypothetical protein NCCP2716_25420 [Sporosarcina sp. NCCP-2716]|uniref:hypothetical protein n=1 Tax=Sporosarcina sp. NCCP-2716 TaxID=2943679 RepID=UPI002041B9B8|nr:hypothetical protein [Sporosarcina sp. NCCP-2716]GKV70044.1 hypothetical protein NCCP2716_25420 [Sporosarcina sp. NCCP-2716]
MFGWADLGSLVISAFIILPVVIFIREFGYLPVTLLFGVRNPRLTIGSGPRLFKFGIFDIRKYYHLYSWFSFDGIRRPSNGRYLLIYSAPILANIIVALGLNALLANGFLESQERFWSRFIFYAFYYVLFDAIPMTMTNGRPNNGMLIYELLRYGKRVDHNTENFIPSTTETDEEYEEEMDRIQKVKESAMPDGDLFNEPIVKHLPDEEKERKDSK